MNKPVREYFASVREIKLDSGTYQVHEVSYIGRNGQVERECHCDNAEQASKEAQALNTKMLAAANPIVGQGGTRVCYSDREPVTVTKVSKNGKKVWVRDNKSVMVKKPTMVPGGFSAFVTEEAEWKILPELEGQEQVYSLRKNGDWVRLGDSMKGERVSFLYHIKFYDHAF